MRILRISSPFLVALACYYTRRTENKNGAFVPLFYKSIAELILRKKIKGIQTEQIDCAFCDWSCGTAPVTKGAINLSHTHYSERFVGRLRLYRLSTPQRKAARSNRTRTLSNPSTAITSMWYAPSSPGCKQTTRGWLDKISITL